MSKERRRPPGPETRTHPNAGDTDQETGRNLGRTPPMFCVRKHERRRSRLH